MPTLSIPTPFRPYTNGASTLEVQATNVGSAVNELVSLFPALQPHLYTDEGKLRSFVNLFLNGEDVRYLQGEDTILSDNDKLRIIPSIAGGNQPTLVDQSVLKTNQATIVLLSILAFLIDQPIIIAIEATFLLIGTLISKPGFSFLYKRIIQPLGLLDSKLIPDDPASHRFAQAIGVLFLGFGLLSFLTGIPGLGWVFVWIVIGLAGLNLFTGFCVGCTLYYWIAKIRQPTSKTKKTIQGGE